MAKIAIILGRLVIGGVSIDTFHAASYLQHANEILIVTGGREVNEIEASFLTGQLTTARHVSITGLKSNFSVVEDIKTYLKLCRILKEFNPDIVHTHSAKAGLIGRMAAIRVKVPIVVHTYHGLIFHSYFNSFVSKLIVLMERWLAKKTSAIIALSQNQKKELVEDYKICKEEKISVIPLGIDLKKFANNLDVNRKKFRSKYLLADGEVAIGLVGRIVPIKNHEYFLGVIGKLKEMNITARYFFVGDGKLRQFIQDKAESLNIQSVYFPESPQIAELTFTSWITETEVVMAGLDIIALTSLSEGTPLALIEAQASKRPVITVDIGGTANIVNHNNTGYVVDSENIDLFSNLLKNLIQDSNLRMQMGENGPSFIANIFDKSLQIDKLVTLYKGLQNSFK